MKKITALTNDAKQSVNLVLDSGARVSMQINFIPNQVAWYYSLTYGTFNVNNMRLVNSPNMLRKFRNIIPFGIACTVLDGYEPIFQSDFTSGRATLYLLNQTDLTSTETLITLTLPNFVGYPLN